MKSEVTQTSNQRTILNLYQLPSDVIANHHRRRLEDGVGDLSNAELLVVGLLRRDNGRVRRKHEVNAYDFGSAGFCEMLRREGFRPFST